MPEQATLEGWGRLPAPGREISSENLPALTRGAVLTRGLGRSYGDSSLPPASRPVAASAVLADRILAFDPVSGVVRGEAGLSLSEIVRLFLPRGFFLPVTPGTRFVTLGGAVASDVHGKNHHQEGTFGRHVRELSMRLADDSVVTCSPTERADLFWATVGGMGLTGHILEVELTLARVPSPWIYQETERIPDIETFVARLQEAAAAWPMTMGWIDCLHRGRGLGRGVLYRGRWAAANEAPARPPRPKPLLPMPIQLPSWVLNPLSIRAFNTLNYWRQVPRVKRAVVSPDEFFYPLDSIRNWNRMYGRHGFTQFQCVLPREGETPAARARRLLDLLTRRGGASFLCVIKDCGDEGQGLLSFPRPGVSIALDIAVRPGTQALIDALNEQVIAEGGRIYLTKDAFTRPEHFQAMEPRLAAFQAVRRKYDPEIKIKSAQSVRLLGDPE